MESNKLLAGVKVVDLSTYVAAPSCGRLLADMGAQVIKVESFKGDPIRTDAAMFELPSEPDENPVWEMYNAGKQAVCLNLRDSAGMEIMHKLLAGADVFVTNTRAKALIQMGLDYDSLKVKYPRLVFAHLLGFGEHGPMKDHPGFDAVAFWTRSGFLGDVVKEGEYPITSPYSFGDVTTGLALFGGICAALVRQARTGLGEKVTVSLYGTSIWCSSSLVAMAQEQYGIEFPKKRSKTLALGTTYLCRDKVWVMLTALDFNRLMPHLCSILGVEWLLSDPRFPDMAGMMEHSEVAVAALEEAFSKLDSADVVARMQAVDIPIEIVTHFKDVNTDEQAWANGYLHEFTFANGNKATLACTPVQTPEGAAKEYRPAPLLGEHTGDVLKDLGYAEEEIAALRQAGAVK